jgi:hypothetical protein
MRHLSRWFPRFYCEVEYHGPIGRIALGVAAAFLGGLGMGHTLWG